MAVISREIVPTGLSDVEHITFVKAVRPGMVPIIGAYRTSRLVEANKAALAIDFPNVVEGYTQPLPDVVRRIRTNRAIARYIVLGETWVGTPRDAYSHIGMLSTVPAEVDGVPETIDGVNIAAWLTEGATGRGYLTRLAAELATVDHPEQMYWTVARPDNHAATGLLANIGMSSVGVPENYDIGDGVTAKRQLYAATVGDVAQTARVYVAEHYPVQVS